MGSSPYLTLTFLSLPRLTPYPTPPHSTSSYFTKPYFTYQSIYLFIYLSIIVPINVYIYVYLYIYISIYLYMYLYISISISSYQDYTSSLNRCGQNRCCVYVQVRATSGKFLSSSEGRTGYAISYNIARCAFSNSLIPKSNLDVKSCSNRTVPAARWPLPALGAYVERAGRFRACDDSDELRIASL